MADSNSIYNQVVVTSITSETSDAGTFELTPINGWQPVYSEGQFITLVFTKHDVEFRRSYSFSSSPALKEPMRITVKRVENGEYSRYLLNHIKVGDVLTTSGIGGFFTFSEEDNRSANAFCFFAAGSGITPVYALIKQVLTTTDHPVMLIYSNRSELDTIFYDALLKLQEVYTGRLKINFLFSNIRDVYKSRLSNWLLIQLLTQYDIDKTHTMFYMCGPFLYMQMIMITLLTEGVSASHIKKENFSTLQPLHKPMPPDTDMHRAEIIINGEHHIINVQYPDAIVASARKQQLHLPYSCEAGRCGSCVATCLNGEVWMAYNEVLVEEEIALGRILTCQAYPVKSDVVISFDVNSKAASIE